MKYTNLNIAWLLLGEKNKDEEGIRVCYVQVPIPHKECKFYVLQTPIKNKDSDQETGEGEERKERG